ncbi:MULTISPECIES: acyl carrier protein [Pseudomonas]|uniref:Acyl carrier protein n=1 Tax=Pseudomonas kielensis TaxID=2762577 RepID=A0A7X1KWS7_9PSED|nr:acyl carrier protein [Pseudomonas kielensis]MBC2689693.1 acyl carrier protein [Pseudomonas kielensis]NBB36314.1 acyl carrier protein [Pseudomonas sp. BC115LW]UZM13262.1 acyl carrier protein [Pseudomonas kielensis]WKL54743.1 acyl carrier protein [Pseudomonas kielensis]
MSTPNAALVAKLGEIVANVIQTTVEPDDLLIESGMVDSLTAVDIVLAVQAAFGCKVPPTEIEEHLESVNALAAFVEDNQKA